MFTPELNLATDSSSTLLLMLRACSPGTNGKVKMDLLVSDSYLPWNKKSCLQCIYVTAFNSGSSSSIYVVLLGLITDAGKGMEGNYWELTAKWKVPYGPKCDAPL